MGHWIYFFALNNIKIFLYLSETQQVLSFEEVPIWRENVMRNFPVIEVTTNLSQNLKSNLAEFDS